MRVSNFLIISYILYEYGNAVIFHKLPVKIIDHNQYEFIMVFDKYFLPQKHLGLIFFINKISHTG
jgi:hypothetical protein